MHRIRSKIKCIEKDAKSLHMRPASFVVRFCTQFPKTEFKILRTSAALPPHLAAANPKSLLSLLASAFQHGETVVVQASGELEIMGCRFLRIILQNLSGYADNIKKTQTKIFRRIDRAFERLRDPDLIESSAATAFVKRPTTSAKPPESSSVVIIDDNLHRLSLATLPLITKQFAGTLQIGFDHPVLGVRMFTIGKDNGFHLDDQIFAADVVAGTRITVNTSGRYHQQAHDAVRAVLLNLRQCDAWLRAQDTALDHPATIARLIEFAKRMTLLDVRPSGSTKTLSIVSLLSPNRVFINAPGHILYKNDVLYQLAAPHEVDFHLSIEDLLARVQESERKEPMILREGFAISHTALPRRPRIAFSFGVYPDGILWGLDDKRVSLVAMSLFAEDCYGTWRAHLRQIARVFHATPDLQQRLVASTSPQEFIDCFRLAEMQMQNM
ncbi:MAG: HPr family phosphocarrier protein [Verrucomicrobia bacterium]|nr:HPr family phosphocarrier protein [Verrucomicrobiota bacterium]